MKYILLFVLLSWQVSFSQVFESSNLPIVIINTNGNMIVDDPKVLANMKIIDNGKGKRNKITDMANAYNGNIGIEYRGSTSQQFPKKPLGLELWDDDKGLKTKDVALFGMPKESDWILFASYNEKSLMHNALTMKLAREMGIYAPRTQYVEVILNGEYQGVYVFMEKIKRATGRVDIAKLKATDVAGDEITGGYIFKVDKSTGTNIGSWQSNWKNQRTGVAATFFYDTPKELTTADYTTQRRYLRAYVDSMETTLYNRNFDKKVGYRKYLDVNSFIKYFLTNEISKNVDGYRISTFLYKDKASKAGAGKIKIGPPWDYDLSYGNADYCNGQSYQGFSYRFNEVCPQDYFKVPFWWDNLMQDTSFVNELAAEYKYQRKSGALQLDRINKNIDSLYADLDEGQVRNFQKWQILGTYIWPNPRPIASTWQGEVAELKTWIANRLDWLDTNMPQNYAILGTENTPKMNWQVFPNPFLEQLTIQVESNKQETAELIIYDEAGRKNYQKNIQLSVGTNTILLNDLGSIPMNQLQILHLQVGQERFARKLIKE